jgi:predicted dehydrogenase
VSARRPPTRIGVVGCGTIAYWTHLRVLARLRDTTLVAAADPDPTARERARGVCSAELHDDAAALLARDDLDALVLCPPSGALATAALAACRRGLPFYVEKPLAVSADEARAVLAAAAAAGVAATVGYNRRHHPVHRRARALLAAGRIGRVRTVLSAFCEPVAADTLPEWKRRRASGGGALLDLGAHHVDLVRWMLGDEIVSVAARIESEASDHDSAWLDLRTAGGVEVRSAFSFRAGPADWISFLGERGTLHVDRFRCTLELRCARRFGYGTRRVHLLPRPANAGWRLRRVARPSHEPSYARALAAFVAEVRDGVPRGARLADGARALAVVLAAEQAAACGRAPAAPDALDADPARD